MMSALHQGSGGGCPFGLGRPQLEERAADAKGNVPSSRAKREAREKRIMVLYEEYIKLPAVRASWTRAVTDKPRLEPLFAAGMQGIELGFVLLAEFLNDERSYVVTRPRIERVANDIQTQMRLLAEIVDAELEIEQVGVAATRGSLQQDFPFEGAPPTSNERDVDKAAQSPALAHLLAAVNGTFGDLRLEQKNSVRKVVRNISGTFRTSFGEWSVGVGIEEQLSALRVAVGLPPFSMPLGMRFLDYTALVRPEVIMATLEDFEHKEDFFFRSVHLGTECWAFVALAQLRVAMDHIATASHWDNAAACIRSAANIYDYLGEHVMMLTYMVLRDYLRLKVEIEGTSGAGSIAVKELRRATAELFNPLVERLTGGRTPECQGELQDLLLALYKNPEKQPALYNYAKALETVESGLLGGFFFRHFCLANNVIGSGAKGTMKMSVQALKKTYERPLFPDLDIVRAELGRRTDLELAHRKGRIMDLIEKRSRSTSIGSASSESTGGSSTDLGASSGSERDQDPGNWVEQVRRGLYAENRVAPALLRAVQCERSVRNAPNLSFLDHAWGKTPPSAQADACAAQFALYQIGNSTWDVMFGELMPEAASHIRRLLNADSKAMVEFGHNSHELVTRLLSVKLHDMLAGKADGLRILTTDTEFYSLTRQLNRLLELPSVQVDTVPIEPLATFEERFLAKARQDPVAYDLVYVSQCVFLTQETIVRDVCAFSGELREALRERATARQPIIVIDGYHGFGAIPTDLSRLPDDVFYVSGTLKHVGGGANCAFMVLPPSCDIRPLLTGWLADPSVLQADSKGISVGSEVGYQPGVALMGSTPAFLPSLLIFLEVMRRWQERGVTVEAIHDHVTALHDRFLAGLADSGPISRESLHSLLPKAARSHTLVFDHDSPSEAKRTVDALRQNHSIEVDSRKSMVRVGFGFNHSVQDVDALAAACRALGNQ